MAAILSESTTINLKPFLHILTIYLPLSHKFAFKLIEIIKVMPMIPPKHQTWKNILTMIGFGIVSLILGTIRFQIPDLNGGGSDMREIGVLLSAIFLPSWIYMLGVSFIASLDIPMHNLEVSTILMHFTASLFAWFYYSYVRKRVENVYILGGLWGLMVVLYYTIFLIPTLVLVFYLYNVIESGAILTMYKNVLYQYRFELFASTGITTLFIVLYRTTRILKVKNEELEEALIKSEESDKLKTEFLSNINHEIRTPLNGIVGCTNLITAPDLSDEQRLTYRSMIHSSSEQLLSTVSNIIELSKIKAGQVDINIARISIKELLENIHLKYSPIAAEKSLLFELLPPHPRGEEIIHTDIKILTQIIDNLLDNAFKFTNQGYVRIGYKLMDGYAVFYVEDTGPGIAKRLFEKIFDHFSKFDNEEDKLYEGIGLGLTIAKALVELLNGSIEVKSEEGKGSTFSFTLPTK
jgi:signal transduction histidine kinase